MGSWKLSKITDDARYKILKKLEANPDISQSQKKTRYLYVLTPAVIENKAALTKRFLKRRMAEYEALHAEIEEVRRELGGAAE